MEEKKDYYKLYLKYKKKYLNLKYKHNSSNFGGASLSIPPKYASKEQLPSKQPTPLLINDENFNVFFIDIINTINKITFKGFKKIDRDTTEYKKINSLDFNDSSLHDYTDIQFESIKENFINFINNEITIKNIFSNHPLISATNNNFEYYSHNCLRVGDIIKKDYKSVLCQSFPQLFIKFENQKLEYINILKKTPQNIVLALQECDFYLFNLIRKDYYIRQNYHCIFLPRSITIKLVNESKKYLLNPKNGNPFVSQYGNVLFIPKILGNINILNNINLLTYEKKKKEKAAEKKAAAAEEKAAAAEEKAAAEEEKEEEGNNIVSKTFISRFLGVSVNNICFISIHMDINEDKIFRKLDFLAKDISEIFEKNKKIKSVIMLGDFNIPKSDIENALKIFKKKKINYDILSKIGNIDHIIKLTKLEDAEASGAAASGAAASGAAASDAAASGAAASGAAAKVLSNSQIKILEKNFKIDKLPNYAIKVPMNEILQDKIGNCTFQNIPLYCGYPYSEFRNNNEFMIVLVKNKEYNTRGIIYYDKYYRQKFKGEK